MANGVVSFFSASAPVTLKQNDPQLQRILNDPEYQRLWQEYDKLAAQVTPEWQQQLGAQGIDAIRASNQQFVAADRAIDERFKQLGGLPNNHYIVRGADGQPRILRKTTTAGQIGRTARQVAGLAGAAFGGVALAGGLAGGAGGAGGAGAAGAGGAGGGAGAASGGVAAGSLPFASTVPIAAAPGALTAGTGIGGGVGLAGTGAGFASTIPIAAQSGPITAAAAPTYNVAANTGGNALSSYFANNAGEYTKAGLSMAGAAMSGDRAQKKATTALLKKRLDEYNRTQPQRLGMETSFLRRLPTHMQGNFPQNFLNTQPAPYNNLNYPQFPNYPY